MARCPECGAQAEILPAGVCRGCHVLALVAGRPGPYHAFCSASESGEDEPDELDAAIAAQSASPA